MESSYPDSQRSLCGPSAARAGRLLHGVEEIGSSARDSIDREGTS